MAEVPRKNWRELCRAALDATDPDELLGIVQELSKALKHEEQVRHDFREAMSPDTFSHIPTTPPHDYGESRSR